MAENTAVPRASTSTPIAASIAPAGSTAPPPTTMTTTAISGRTSAETVSSRPPMTSPALARSSGMRPLRVQQEPRGDVRRARDRARDGAPGEVRTHRVRPREAPDEDPVRGGVGHVRER